MISNWVEPKKAPLGPILIDNKHKSHSRAAPNSQERENFSLFSPSQTQIWTRISAIKFGFVVLV